MFCCFWLRPGGRRPQKRGVSLAIDPDVGPHLLLISLEMNALTPHHILGIALGLSLANIASAQSELFEVTGDKEADHFGVAMACAGDFNNDGHPDLIIGAPEDANIFVSGEGFARVHSGLNGAVLFTPKAALTSSAMAPPSRETLTSTATGSQTSSSALLGLRPSCLTPEEWRPAPVSPAPSSSQSTG